jgi:lipopolysaccharide export system ATP-binding protein
MRTGLYVEHISKHYKTRPILRDFSMHVAPGEAVALLGPNGAGKTTSFYCVTGIIHPNSGKIFIDNQDITSLPIYMRSRLGVGYLPQESSIFRNMTVEENILAVLEMVEEKPDKRSKILDELLGEFSITHLRNSPATALSGGERRRVEIARALAASPRFILLDEPLAGIDPVAVGEIRHLISHLKNRGLGVLITDHNVRETLEIVDRAYVLHEGKILTEGTPAEIITHPDVRRVYLGEKFSM